MATVNTVDSTSAAYNRMKADYWGVARALMGGTPEMRRQGEVYLPRYAKETDTTYNNRRNRTTLTNIYKECLQGIVNKVFSKPVVIDQGTEDEPAEVDKRFLDFWENVDLIGNNGDTFAKTMFFDAMQTAIGYILVDYPTAQPGETAKDQIGRRPFWVFIPAENVIAAYYETLPSGRRRLSHLRYKASEVRKKEGDYTEETVEVIRVFTPGEVQRFERVLGSDGKGEWQSQGIAAFSFGRPASAEDDDTNRDIPIVPLFCGKRVGDFEVEPILADLAWKNVEHWQTHSEYIRALGQSCFSMLAVRGTLITDPKQSDGAPLNVGPSVLLQGDSDTDFYYVEPSGAGVGLARQHLEDLKEEMRIMGLQPLMPKTGNMVATGRALDQAEADSVIKSTALTMKDAIEMALVYTARWFGLSDEDAPSVTVNTDYGISLRAATEVAELTKMRAAGEISRKTYWREVKRRGFLSDDFDVEKETEELDAEDEKRMAENEAAIEARMRALETGAQAPAGGGNAIRTPIAT